MHPMNSGEPSPVSQASSTGAVVSGDRLGLSILCALLLVFFYPLLFGDRIIFYYDFTFITYPMRFLLHHWLREGVWPFWNPYAHGGEPFLAGFIIPVLYPPNLLLYLPDYPLAQNLFYVFHFYLLGVPLYLLIRKWGSSVNAALAGSLTAVFSGFYLDSVLVNNYFLANCWFPFLLYVFERYWREGRIRFFLLGLFGLTSLTLAGSPSSSLMTVLLLAAFAWFYPPRPGLPRSVRFRRLLGGAGAVILALALSAPQLVSTFHLLKHSQRQGGLDFEKHAKWSMELQQATELFLPRDLTGFLNQPFRPEHEEPEPKGLFRTIYMGVFPVLALLLTIGRSRMPPLARFWSWVTWLGLFLALGKFNGLYKVVYWGFPLVRILRYPEKYLFLVALGLSILGALAVDALTRRNGAWVLTPARWLAVTAGLLGLGAVSGYWLPFRPLWGQLLLIGMFGALGFALVRRVISPRAGGSLLVGLMVLDLGLHHWTLPPMTHRSFQEMRPVLMDYLTMDSPHRVYSGPYPKLVMRFSSDAHPTRMVRQIVYMELLQPYTGLPHGVEYPDGLGGVGLYTENFEVWSEVFEKSSMAKRRLILERSNVAYWVNWTPVIPFSDRGVPLITPDRIIKLENPLPRAFLVGRARAGRPVFLLNTYFDPAFDPRHEVILNQPPPGSPSPDFDGQVEALRYAPNRVTVQTRQNAPGWLVLLDSYFPGWSVTVDGEPGEILQANQFYRAVRLAAGQHTVEFRFEPEGWATGVRIFQVAVAGLVLTLVILLRRRGKPRPREDALLSN